MKTTYKVSGWKMIRDCQTYEVDRGEFIEHILVESVLKNIDGYEDRCFLEVEVSKQIGCEYFELDTLEIK
jgi:hypothetical protein